MRGLLVPTFCPKKNIRSVCSKSSSPIVPTPTPTPIDAFRPTLLLSWHMFELSGRLLVPYWRANSCSM